MSPTAAVDLSEWVNETLEYIQHMHSVCKLRKLWDAPNCYRDEGTQTFTGCMLLNSADRALQVAKSLAVIA